MMTRFVLTLLVGLTVSLGALVSGVEPVLAKNWNQSEGTSNQALGKSIIFQYPLDYRATFNCNGEGNFSDRNNVFHVSKNSISLGAYALGGSGDENFEYNRNTTKLTMSGMDLPSSMVIGGMRASDLGNVIKPYDRPRFLIDNKSVSIGQSFRESGIKLLVGSIALTGYIDFKLMAFEKYKNMNVASGEYVLRFSGNQSGKQVRVLFRGTLKYHLGSGFIARNEVSSAKFTVGGQTKVSEGGILECSLVGKEQLHRSVELALGFEHENDNKSLAESKAAKPKLSSPVQGSPSILQSDEPTSAELLAAQRKAKKLERELAALKTDKAKEQKAISSDNKQPVISASAKSSGQTNAVVSGKVSDNIEVAEVTVGGEVVSLTGDGSFETSFYIPRAGKTVEIVAFDTKGNKATKSLFLERGAVQGTTGPVFASLNPSGKRVKPNKGALALIIGVADYERTSAKAAYADKDAKTFYDYAMLKLGVPAGNIKELVNVDANRIDVALAIKDWIARTTKQGSSDIYVFFAGHGLASQSGEEMYLLPYDGSPRLLEDSAISRERLFSDIASANPRSVTVFLDTCYSGTTRGTDMLIASRPIAIKALEQSIPDNFTVMTAAAGDQTAKPLEEAKHGMFSYFLMKGMEGEADQNQDNKITAGELHQYVQQNVVQQSSGSQTPELQGDANRVLVQFQ